jgi:peroxiredoxin
LWAVLAAAVAVNLVLTFAVLRRLREQDERIGKLEGGAPARDELIGREPAPFSVVTADGGVLTHEDLSARPVLVGFFSSGCEPCHTQSAPFRQAVVDGRLAGYRVVAVVDGPPGEDRQLVETVGAAEALIEGPQAQTIAAAFGVVGFPSFVELSSGRVIRASPAFGLIERQLA